MDNSDIAPAQWASAIPRIFVRWYHQNYPFYRNITQSAVDTARLEAVADALDALAGSLLAKRTLYVNALARARKTRKTTPPTLSTAICGTQRRLSGNTPPMPS
jgi:hypothetical protein